MGFVTWWRSKQALWTVIGSFLLIFPMGIQSIWGNISIYPLSYILVRLHSTNGLQAPWVIGLYFACQSIGLFMVGMLSKYIGKRLALTCGLALFLIGVFGTYFTVQQSVAMITVSLGVVAGLGYGFTNGMGLEYAVPWAGKHIGLVSSFVQGAFSSGPIFLNQFISFYANPNNEVPDLISGPSLYFSQDDVLNKVPSIFLVYGLICLGCLFPGFLLVREFKTGTSEEQPLTSTRHQHGNGDTGSVRRERERESDTKDLSPREVIKTRPFYTLWFACVFFTSNYVVIMNYYKFHGQLWIKDDYFFAYMGTAFAVSITICGPIWGLIIDKVGVKFSMMLMFSITTMSTFVLYFTPMINKWTYLASMILYGSSSSSIFTGLASSVCILYGHKHHSSNFGMVISSDICIGLITPILYEMLLLNFGWLCVFGVAALLPFSGLLLIALTLPQC